MNRESISICRNLAASTYAAAADGTTTASLRISEDLPSGKFFIRAIITAPARNIRAVAASVFTRVAGNPSNIKWPNFFRSTVTRIMTCRYEHTAVAAASPAVPRYQIRVRFRTILVATAYKALRAGVFESCIE